MGAGNTKQTQSIDLSLNHPKFHNGKFVLSDKQRLMQITLSVDNKQYDKWKQKLQKEKLNPEFLLLPASQDFSTKGLCGNSGTLTLDFKDFPYLLTEEIAHRKGKKRLFQQNQLWYLLFALISAKKNMRPTFSKIGDVRPQNIFINDQGQVKISNIFSWPHQTTNFTKAFENEVTYLAPQQVKQLETGEAQSQKNNESELFSIGLTLLSAATLDDFLDAYDLKKFSINETRINEKLNEFKLNRAYSDIFKGVVCNLCQFNPQRRVNSAELWNLIAPHEQKIMSRENFFIPEAPIKIHQEVNAVRQSVNLLLGNSRESGILLGSIRGSGVSGQKLNFPSPIIRSSVPNSSFVLSNAPSHVQAQSVYIPTTIQYSSQPGTVVGQSGTKAVINTKEVLVSSSPQVSSSNDQTKNDSSAKKDLSSKKDLQNTPGK